MNIPPVRGTLAFLAAWLVPWRPVVRAHASDSQLTFFVHRRDMLGRHIMKYGTHETLLTRWIARYLAAARPGIVVDAGANIGWHALHAARHASVEAVIAFEPDAFNTWLLDRSLAANGIDKVIVDCRALGAAPGSARLYRYKSSNAGRHTIVADHGYGQGSRQVPVTDLDGALAGLGFGERPVSLFKVDVEGYEPAVLAGARQTLARTDAMILEYSPALMKAGRLAAHDMLARLQALAFVPFALDGLGATLRLTIQELQEFSGELADSMDVIWIRAERLGDLAGVMRERERGSLTFDAIAVAYKSVV